MIWYLTRAWLCSAAAKVTVGNRSHTTLSVSRTQWYTDIWAHRCDVEFGCPTIVLLIPLEYGHSYLFCICHWLTKNVVGAVVYPMISRRRFQQLEVLEGQNILVTISGKKSKIRVYYLSWLKTKILKTDVVCLCALLSVIWLLLCKHIKRNYEEYWSEEVGVLASEGWWEAWQTSAKVTRSY